MTDASAAPPRPPALHFAPFLRATAIVSVIGATLGLVVAPGLRGVASDAVVEPMNRLAWALSYFMCGLVVTAIVGATLELARAPGINVVSRATAIGASGGSLALAAPALSRSLPATVALALAVSASAGCLAAAFEGMRRPHTRAVAVVLAAFAVASLARVVSWEIARVAGDTNSLRLVALSRGVATGALVVEGLGQMFAAAWLGTRGRLFGQVLSSAAVVGAFLLTWNASRGASDMAAPWQSALHVALGSAPGLPQPFGMSALAVFLVVCSILLALVAAVQPRAAPAVVFALSLALLGRGSLDVPLRALCAVAGGLWLLIATVDDRAMWRTLLAERAKSDPGPRPTGAREERGT